MHKILFCLFVVFVVLSNELAADDIQNVNKEAKALVTAFAKELKQSLTSAIQEGGLEKGIEVCSVQAPLIAAELSTNGWHLKRVSLKNRNPENQPDQWEQSILALFDKENQLGQNKLPFYKSKFDHNTFRAMQAIPTAQICLACHGENISSGVQNKLKEFYPNDIAVGYKVGDIRGAFSLVKKIN